jgi:hypothetical protein
LVVLLLLLISLILLYISTSREKIEVIPNCDLVTCPNALSKEPSKVMLFSDGVRGLFKGNFTDRERFYY